MNSIKTAVQNGELETLKELMNTTAYDIRIIFQDACIYGHLHIVKYLLPIYNELKIIDGIIVSINHDQMEILDYLLDDNAKYNSLLAYASIHKKQATINYLIKNKIDKLSTYNLLAAGVTIQNIDLIDFAIKKSGSEEEVNCREILTGLFKFGHDLSLETVKILLSKISDKKTTINTVIMHACRHNKMDIVKFLIDEGADNFNDAIVECVDNKELSDIILHNVTNNNNLFRYACRNNDIKLINVCLEKEVDVNIGLLSAVNYGNIDTIRYLISKGANRFNKILWTICRSYKNKINIENIIYILNYVDNIRPQVLTNTIYYNNVEVAQCILESKFSFKQKKLNEALLLSIRHRRKQLVELLLKKGANNFEEALDLAVDMKNYKLVKFLINKGAKSYNELKEHEVISLLHSGMTINQLDKHPSYNNIYKKIHDHKTETSTILTSILIPEIIKIINDFQLF
jgi:ankyrin repeat protein